MSRVWNSLILLLFVLSTAVSADAQTKKTKRPVKQIPQAATPKPTPDPTPEVIKMNKRPDAPVTVTGDSASVKTNVSPPVYFYEFSHPGFAYERIQIKHDDEGRGNISMQKNGLDQPFNDAVALSAATMKKISDAVTALDFLNSTESYQYERDYSHLGNMTLTLRRAGRSREAKYNWTDNKYARILMDEYRRISNEYTWRFEVGVARENQPLLTPGLMESLDSYLNRKEISDPENLLPFLRSLSTDERLPLMARNRADRVIKRIEKSAK